MTEPLYASSAPVFKVDGTVRGEMARDLLRLDVAEDTGGLRSLTAHLVGVGAASGASEEQLLYMDSSILDFGRRLEVSIGPPGTERIVFSGRVSGLEADMEEGRMPHVMVLAEDDLMKLRMTRRMRTYENVTDADIARAIAAEHGLSADVAADGPTYDVVQQWNQSDLAFLRERARLVQAEIWTENGTLGFKTRANRTSTSLTLVMGNHLIAARSRADLAHQRTAITVSGYDAQARDTIEEEAGSEAVLAEVSGGRNGPDVLRQAFGDRVSFRLRQAPLVARDATDWAKAEMLRRARRFVTVVGTTRGSPDMVVGSRLELQRVGAPFSGGGYYVTRVRHTYDLTSGHRTHFEAERPTLGGAAA
jgi:phage protein D